MRTRSFLWFLVFVIFLCVNATVIAKERKSVTNVKKKAAHEKKEDARLVIPFDINAEKLHPNYKGTDIARLYSLLAEKAPLEKAEFETTAEYEKKIREAISGDIYALKIEEGHGLYGLKVSPYDADTQKFQISLETEWLSEYTFEDHRASFILKTLNKSSYSYIGSNAFGAKRLVTNYDATQYGLALVNQQDFGSSSYDDDKYNIKTALTSIRKVSIAIQIPPDKAKSLKENIGVLLLCKPALYKSEEEVSSKSGNDLIFEKHNSSKATIDNPASHFYERKYINVEILSIWIYDIGTGEVLSKKHLKDKKKEKENKKEDTKT